MARVNAQAHSSHLRSRDSLFRYEPLSGHHAIRLLRIEKNDVSDLISCSLEDFELSYAPKYTAVSYCWGATQLFQDILVNGKIAEITQSLAAVLRQQGLDARSEEQHFWADALCINQVDIQEKDGQIKLMPLIFARAVKVITWLGRADSDIARLKMIEQFVSQGCVLPDNIHHAKAVHRSLSRAFMALGQSNYWRRIWEVGLARCIEVTCGPIRVTWEDFHRVLSNILDDRSDDHWKVIGQSMRDFVLSSCRQVNELNVLRERIKLHVSIPLLQALYWTRDCDATYTKDKIFALLGLVTDSWHPSRSLFYGDSLEASEKKITLLEMADMSPSGAVLGRPYRLDIITFTNVSYQRGGARRWSPNWTDRSVWTGLRRWQWLRLDWHLPPFRATEPLLQMPEQSNIAALGVHGRALGTICMHSELAPWIYRHRGALAKVARDLLQELDAHPRKGLLNWLSEGRDDKLDLKTKADLTMHRKRLSDLLRYVEVHENHVITDAEIAKDTFIEEGVTAVTQKYKSELRDYLLMGSSIPEASSTWSFHRMQWARTSQGFMGFALQYAQPGDFVYLIHGCSVPLVLRRHGSGLTSRGYVVVGEMFALGIMQGEYFRKEHVDSILMDGAVRLAPEERIDIL